MQLTQEQRDVITQRDGEGRLRNMFEVAEELFPMNYALGVETIRAFLYDWDDLDIDDEGNVIELGADDEPDTWDDTGEVRAQPAKEDDDFLK